MFQTAIAHWARGEGRDPATVSASRVEQIPLGRLAAPGEIAAAAGYLAALRTPRLVVLNQSGGETFNH